LHVGEVIRHIERADTLGLRVPKAEIERESVAKYTKDVVNANVNGVKTLFKANGVESIIGEATLTSANDLTVKKKDGGNETIAADYVVIATGSARRSSTLMTPCA
jgi:pyruvate/2-oxoglutarate dehydrogenase complex dihydrolipoamide dehydrogenase (E3) component